MFESGPGPGENDGWEMGDGPSDRRTVEDLSSAVEEGALGTDSNVRQFARNNLWSTVPPSRFFSASRNFESWIQDVPRSFFVPWTLDPLLTLPLLFTVETLSISHMWFLN